MNSSPSNTNLPHNELGKKRQLCKLLFLPNLTGEFLGSGRDLLLSSTVNLHRAFVNAGVNAQLIVFDGLWHAYWNEWTLPESKEAHHRMADFFNLRLGK